MPIKTPSTLSAHSSTLLIAPETFFEIACLCNKFVRYCNTLCNTRCDTLCNAPCNTTGTGHPTCNEVREILRHTLQHTLQHTTVQGTRDLCDITSVCHQIHGIPQHTKTLCNTLEFRAPKTNSLYNTPCNTLQYRAPEFVRYRNTLKHSATH